MSKIAIQGNASGTGTFTIAAPVGTGTDRTLTLPDEAGTVVTNTGADFTDQVTVTKTSAGASTNGLIVKNADNTAGTAASIGFAAHGSGVETHRIEGAVDGANAYSIRFQAYQSGLGERMRVGSTGVMMGRTQASIDNSKGFYHRNSDGYTYIVRNTGNLCLDLLQSSTGDIIRFNNSSIVATGTISCTSSTTSYNTSSDYRLKENVVDMTGAIDRVKALNPSQFNFIVEPDRTVDGFLAHEVQTVVPEAVTGTHNQVEVWAEGEELPEGVSVGDNKLDENGNTIPVYQGIDQAKLVPLLTGALQEAIAKIETLETTVADLQTRVTALESV